MEPHRPRVLVIDDLPDTADSFATLLAIWGYDAEPLYDGVSALVSARARPPAAVLLDIGMPRLDGFRFAELFRKLPRCANCPIIAVTGYTGQAYRDRATEVGIDHYLLKPVDLALVKNLLASRRRPRRRSRRAVAPGVAR